MRKQTFGFDALAQRARVHRLRPVEIPIDRRIDLSIHLKLRYGDAFVPHPRLPNAIRLNLGEVAGLLTEDAAARAWQHGDYAAVLRSLAAKVGAIAKLLERVRRGSITIAGAPDARPPRPKVCGPLGRLQAAAVQLRLKGNEAAVITALCERDGTVPIADLAVGFEWDAPYTAWNSTRVRLNRKLKGHGWRLETDDGAAVAKPIPRALEKRSKTSARGARK
jgi:hypothetical protein